MRQQTEKQFMAEVVKLAKLKRWHHIYHTYNSHRSNPGFPDLCLVRKNRIIFAEIKSEKGWLSAFQKSWVAALVLCPVEVYVWRPSDMDTIIEVLS